MLLYTDLEVKVINSHLASFLCDVSGGTQPNMSLSYVQEFESSVEKEAIHPLTRVPMAEKIIQWQSQVQYIFSCLSVSVTMRQ